MSQDSSPNSRENTGSSPPPLPPRTGPVGTGPAGNRDEQRNAGTTLFVSLVFVALIIGTLFMSFGRKTGATVAYSFFREQLALGNVKEVLQHPDSLEGAWIKPPLEPLEERKASSTGGEKPTTEDGKVAERKPLPERFHTVLPTVEDRDLIPLMVEKKVKFVSDRSDWATGANLAVSILMLVLMVAFMWMLFRRTSDPMGAGGIIGNFARSPAKLFRNSDQQNTFEDVAGMEQAKIELQEVVEFLKNPAKFIKLGAHIPKGVLLMGSPGTGKTLLARATAGEAGVPFFSINGSEFIQMFVGVGASRVRDMFATAKAAAPCILFIDEIDAVGRVRGAGVGGGHDEREQTLNQILSEMDGFQQSEAVIVLAATNRPDVLDPALLRPGRFDRHVSVDRPTRAGRLGILKVHTRKVPLADDVDLDRIAASTIGFSGAELKNLVNEAALQAARIDRSTVSGAEFEQARDRVLMGVAREEVMNDHERKMTAYHEAGHALLAWSLSELDPVHKVTIIPRGRALGVTQLLPTEDRYSIGENRLKQQLIMSMGGRAAEKLVFDEYTAGAEGDLNQATSIARRMVSRWGMSETVGPVAFRQGDDHPFLGKEMHEAREFSEETARIIDEEIQRLLMGANSEAIRLLNESRSKLDLLAETLLKQEIVTREEMGEMFGERPPGARAPTAKD
jgi:cell division protease FtsH